MRIGNGFQNPCEGLLCTPFEHTRTNHALRNCQNAWCDQTKQQQHESDLARCLSDSGRGFRFPSNVEFVIHTILASKVFPGSEPARVSISWLGTSISAGS